MSPSQSLLWTGVLIAVVTGGCKTPEKTPGAETTPATKTSPQTTQSADAKHEADASAGATETVTMVEEVEQPAGSSLEAVAHELTTQGRAVAVAIDDAVGALEKGKAADAKARLEQARKDLAAIEAERPSAKIAVELWRGNKALGSAEAQGTIDTIPLLAMLGREDVMVYDADAVKAQHEARQAQDPASVTAKDAATDLEIVDSNLVYEEIDLPIATTEIHVLAAQKLIDEGKLEEAKAALLDAVESFEVLAVIERAPEYQARQLVWDAQAAFAHGELAKAKRLLAEASAVLEPISKDDEDPQAKHMAGMLLAEIAPLQGALRVDDTAALGELRRLERGMKVFARRAAMRAVLLARREHERIALADALMWLEKAETDGLAAGKDGGKDGSGGDGASADLRRAKEMLDKAAKDVSPSVEPRVDDLIARVEHLTGLETAEPRDAGAVEAELRRATFDLRMLLIDRGYYDESKQG